MQRRTFLKALTAGSVAGGLGSYARPKANRLSKRGGVKKLVVLFQRGGNDGLNTLIPVDSGEYNLLTQLRPQIRVPLKDILEIPGNSFFGLHPAMASLVPVLEAGGLSMIHAVAYPDSDRSHFESQGYYETAVPGQPQLEGWLGRLIHQTEGPGVIRGISIGSNLPQAASGNAPFPVSTNFGRTSVDVDPHLDQAGAAAYDAKIRELLSHQPGQGSGPLYDTGNQLFQMLDSFGLRELDDYIPENGALYPETPLGDQVRHAAQMLKDDQAFLGVEVVTLDQGGYDTHAGQLTVDKPTAGVHADLLTDLADSMAAFYTDMGPVRMAETLFLVISEFGRRAYQNDSQGTDHGTGGVAMVMGGGNSGVFLNGADAWPGLSDLYRDGDLLWLTDYRDIYWEILSRHMNVDTKALSTVIPGHTHTPVGFLLA